jgi:hypothetical protein
MRKAFDEDEEGTSILSNTSINNSIIENKTFATLKKTL